MSEAIVKVVLIIVIMCACVLYGFCYAGMLFTSNKRRENGETKTLDVKEESRKPENEIEIVRTNNVKKPALSTYQKYISETESREYTVLFVPEGYEIKPGR